MMMKKYLLAIGLLSLLLPLSAAKAQDVNDVNTVFALPSVYVQNLNVQTSGETVKGTFEAYNADNSTVGGLNYDILILAPRADAPDGEIVSDNAAVYSQAGASENFSVSAKETKKIDFSANVGSLPQGNYRVRIWLKTVGDRQLGWDDATVTLGETGTAFVLVSNQVVEVESTDPVTGESKTTWQALEGPNVDPGKDFSVTATVKNQGGTALTFKPEISSERILITADKDSTKKIFSGETITLRPGGEQKISVPITAQENPGAYAAFLNLVDEKGQVIASNKIEYRYVVKGESASVLSATVGNLPTKAGEAASLEITISGAADRETTFDGRVEVSLLAGNEVIGSGESKVDLKAGVSQTGRVLMAIKKDLCVNSPSLLIKIYDSKNNLLENYQANLNTPKTLSCETSASSSEEKQKSGLGIWIILAAATLILIILAVIVFVSKKTKKSKTILMTLLALLIISGAFFTINPEAKAGLFDWLYPGGSGQSSSEPVLTFGTEFNWIDQELYKFNWSIFINKPQHNASLAKSNTMEYEYVFKWSACENQTITVSSNIYILTSTLNGSGHLDKSNYSKGSWQQIGSKSYAGAVGGATLNYFANLTLPASFPNENTLRTYFFMEGRLRGALALLSGWFDKSANATQLTWINFTPALTCAPDLAAKSTGSSVTFTASGGDTSQSTKWFYPADSTSASATGANTFTVTPQTPGTHYVRLERGNTPSQPLGPTTNVWSKDPNAIRDFVNSKATENGFAPIPATGALNMDNATALKVCNLAGYAKASNVDCKTNNLRTLYQMIWDIVFGRRKGCSWNFGELQGKTLAKWDSSSNSFVSAPVRLRDKWMSTLTCSNPTAISEPSANSTICSVEAVSPLQCSSEPSSAQTGNEVTFNYVGGNPTLTTNEWTSTEGDPDGSEDESFITKFYTAGQKTVTIKRSSAAAPPTPSIPEGDEETDEYTVETFNPVTTNVPPKASWFRNPFGIVRFVNSKMGNVIPAGTALRKSYANAQKVCNLAGYSKVDSYSCRYGILGLRCGFLIPFPLHRMADWNGSQFVFSKASWFGNNQWLSSLSCSMPISSPPTPTLSPTSPPTPAPAAETASCTVNISEPRPSDPLVINITANPNPVDYNEKTTVAWSVDNATVNTVCSGTSSNNDVDWDVERDIRGTQKVTPSHPETTYTLTCTKEAGARPVFNSVVVTVNNYPEPIPTPAIKLTADQNPVEYNNGTTVRWTTENATSCYPSSTVWENAWPTSENNNKTTGEHPTDALIEDKTYELTCSGPGGPNKNQVTVNVNQQDTTPTSIPIPNFQER